MERQKRYVVLFTFLVTSLFALIFFTSNTQATTRDFSANWQCNTNVDVEDCEFNMIDQGSSVDSQLYWAETFTTYNGHDNDSTIRIDVCLTQTPQMWSTDACGTMFGRQGVKGFSSGSGVLEIGSNDLNDYNHAVIHMRVNDANSTTTLKISYRRVSIDSFTINNFISPPPVKVGDTITVNWGTDWALGGAGSPAKLTWSGAVGNNFEVVPTSGPKTFTAQSAGTATFVLKACGPGNNGSTCVEETRSITVEPAPTQTCQDPGATNFGGSLPCTYPAGLVNLNITAKDICTNAGILGAVVTINQDFGNGTTRTTDGEGFANFGVAKNTNIGWSIAANGYNTATGSVNSGNFGAGMSESLTRDCGQPPPPPPSEPPPAPPGKVNLTVSISGPGSISTADGKISNCTTTCTTQYDELSTPEVIATANSGAIFESWLQDGCGTIQTSADKKTSTCFMAGMRTDENMVANFTTAPSQPTTGNIIVTSKDVDTGSAVNTTWILSGPFNDTVTNAISSKNYTSVPVGQYSLSPQTDGTTHFLSRVDISCSNNTSCNGYLAGGSTLNYTILYKAKCTSNCTPTIKLTVNKTGSGTVTSNPSGINCDASCSSQTATFSAISSAISLSPSPSTGYRFDRWSNPTGGCSTNGVCSTSNGDSSITANFVSISGAGVRVEIFKQGAQEANGIVSGSGPGQSIYCGAGQDPCIKDLNPGDWLDFSHSETNNATWGGWSGACSGTGSCRIDLIPEGSIKTLYATFNGPVISGLGRIVVDSNCTHVYTVTGPGGTFGGVGDMTFENKPAGTYTIDWEPKPVTTVNQQTQTLSGESTITFTLNSTQCSGGGQQEPQPTTAEAVCTVNVESRYTLSVSKSGSGTGTIIASGINCGSDCSEQYNNGTVVSITANPSAGSIFAGWSGACSGTGGCSVTMNGDKSVTALFNGAPTVSNVTVTQPNYCISGSAATVNWTYSDPTGGPQSSYQVQIDNQGSSYQTPIVDSGKVNSSSNSYFTGQGVLQFGVTYKARVRAWNSYDSVSSWTDSGSWKTPNNAYPQVDFTWSPASPQVKKPVQFTDLTTFYGNQNGRNWSWLFGDGGSSAQQNPSYTYNNEGIYYATLTATDSNNQSCSRTKGPVSVQKAIPKWREIAPK